MRTWRPALPLDDAATAHVRRTAEMIRARHAAGTFDDLLDALLLPVRASVASMLRAVVAIDDASGERRDSAH